VAPNQKSFRSAIFQKCLKISTPGNAFRKRPSASSSMMIGRYKSCAAIANNHEEEATPSDGESENARNILFIFQQ
jgi:hypothetical protein